MQAAAEAGFLAWTARFFVDASSPSPLSPTLHPHLAKERALLNALANGSSLESFLSRELATGAWATPFCLTGAAAAPGGGGGAAAAPGHPVPSSTSIKTALHSFGLTLLAAGRAIRAEALPTTHIWHYDLFGAIVNHPARADLLTTAAHFDSIADAWERVIATIWQVSGAPADTGLLMVRFFSPLIDRGMGRMYRRGCIRRVSFPNALYSLCAGMT